MLQYAKGMIGCELSAADGIIGHIKDFYFDDRLWMIRYFVVDIGNWMSSRKVLVSPTCVGKPNWEQKLLRTTITRDQVKDSPDINTHKPVSLQHEMEHIRHFGHPAYWRFLRAPRREISLQQPSLTKHKSGELHTSEAWIAPLPHDQNSDLHETTDPCLRSFIDVIGHGVHANDGAIGHVEGMLIDEHIWAVRYLVVDTSDWWIGHKVLIAPQWIEAVNWGDRSVVVGMTRQAVREAPAFELWANLTQAEEIRLYRHYGHTDYWSGRPIEESELSGG